MIRRAGGRLVAGVRPVARFWVGVSRRAHVVGGLVCVVCVFGFSAASAWATSGAITDYVGTGNTGAPTPGPAASSRLDGPQQVTIDKLGDVYITDTSNQRVEKITPDGTLSVIAGNGARGAATPGPATGSKLCDPQGVAVDAAGNVYIADTNNDEIDKVTPGGTLSIVAGNGTPGCSGGSPPAQTVSGPALQTPLGDPMGVAIDPTTGDVIVADTLDHTISRIDPNGNLTLIAGNHIQANATAGPALQSSIDDPEAVAVDPHGNVLVADSNGNEIEKITPGGTLSIVAGDGTSGTPTQGLAANSKVNYPMGVWGDAAGDIYIADTSNNLIEEVSPSGNLSVIAGNGSQGVPTYGVNPLSSPLDAPIGVAVNPSGTIYVVDWSSNTAERIGPAAPGAPGQPTVNPGDGSATLTFAPPTDDGTSSLTGYQVSLDNGASWQNITTTPGAGSTLTATLSGLADGTSYSALVRAVNTTGGGAPSAIGGPVTPEAPASDTTLPTISGTPTVGQTLTATTGTWAGTSLTYSYQWLLDGNAISGATSATYTLASGDAGHHVSVRITAVNAMGQISATSASASVTVPIPTPAPPTTTTATPVTAPPVTLGPVPSAGVQVSADGGALLSLVCPQTSTGCDASGVLTIFLPKTLDVRVPSVSAANSTVLASFSGAMIASGHSALVAVRLRSAVLERLQSLYIRRVKVTLSLSNHLTGGPTVNSTQTLYLLIPPLTAARCADPTGQLNAATLGAVTLGATRARTHQMLPRFTVRSYHTDNFCLSGGQGVRVGYASARLLGTSSTAKQTISRTVVLALTANRFYTLRGVPPGARVATAAHQLKLADPIRWGVNDWYVVPGATSNGLLKVRHGIIEEVGIVNKQLTTGRAAQLRLLRNF